MGQIRVRQTHLWRVRAEGRALDANMGAPLRPSALAQAGKEHLSFRSMKQVGSARFLSGVRKGEVCQHLAFHLLERGGRVQLPAGAPAGAPDEVWEARICDFHESRPHDLGRRLAHAAIHVSRLTAGFKWRAVDGTM